MMPSDASSPSSIQPSRFEQGAPLLLAGLSREYRTGTPMDFMAQWKEFSVHIGNLPGQQGHVGYGVCNQAAGGQGIEYMCAMQVDSISKLPETLTYRHMPAYSYVVFTHDGDVSTLRNTLDAIAHEWAPHSGYESVDNTNLFFERYGERFDPHTGRGDIEVWVPVKPNAERAS